MLLCVSLCVCVYLCVCVCADVCVCARTCVWMRAHCVCLGKEQVKSGCLAHSVGSRAQTWLRDRSPTTRNMERKPLYTPFSINVRIRESSFFNTIKTNDELFSVLNQFDTTLSYSYTMSTSPTPEEQGTKVFCGNLPFSVGETELQDLFATQFPDSMYVSTTFQHSRALCVGHQCGKNDQKIPSF